MFEWLISICPPSLEVLAETASLLSLVLQQSGKTKKIMKRKKTPEAIMVEPRLPSTPVISPINGAKQAYVGGP